MKIDQLRTVTISDTALEWFKTKYTAANSFDAEGYRKFLSEDCQLQFGNNPIVGCNNEIIGGLKSFWETINGMNHSFINIIGTDNYFVAEAIVGYTRKDNKLVQIPAATIIERNAGGLVTSMRIFIDITPIYHHLPTR